MSVTKPETSEMVKHSVVVKNSDEDEDDTETTNLLSCRTETDGSSSSNVQTIISLLDPILSPLIGIGGHFLGKLLQHPEIQMAVGGAVVCGVKQLCHESDLHSHLSALDEIVSQHQEEDARKLGRDLKKVTGHFFKGIFENDKDDRTDGEKNNEHDKE